ncbi:uncharacterized protein TNIN_215911 [Trichonephila inaurata madagascariensis]|uniref:Uncharacterized protein n=1 Tax=Trichonephila inaurata madagascariensis TaxID=2747483 RepID=A0A8X6Y3S7_9ARAC|nr:uncharacterized protein TNIN_215911 [Trichonephila inaurata madagascariensis]
MVSLPEISCSQDEMDYITRMRNAFKFRTASSKDYSFLNSSFQHLILCSSRRKPVLETCLRHTLSKVMKSHVLQQDYTPFSQRTLINIGEDWFPTEGNLGQPIRFIQGDDEHEETGSFLIASLKFQWKFSLDTGWSHWNIPQSQFLMDTILCNLQDNNAEGLNSMHASGWRRVFADNFIDFNCTDSGIASYIKEQTEVSRPVHVFKKIFKREKGETFNPFRILESIASPYYYVLPQHGEESVAIGLALRNRGIIPVPCDELFCFESRSIKLL